MFNNIIFPESTKRIEKKCFICFSEDKKVISFENNKKILIKNYFIIINKIIY